MELVNNFWADDRGNRWSASKYHEEEAEQLSESLTYCTGCINCKNCTNCNYCIDCEYCNNCIDCQNCSNCTDCSDCLGSDMCIDCHTCSFCDKCYGCVERSNYSSNYDILPDVYRREKLNKEMDERIFAKV